jgi:hypothetical protein
MSEENKTGLVMGRLLSTDLIDMIVDSERKEMRSRFVEWLLVLSEFIHDNRGNLQPYDYALVVSLPLVKKKEEDKRRKIL